MKMTSQLCCLALLCLLVSQVSGSPALMQADDWSASTVITSTLDQYVKPYTGALVGKVRQSDFWILLGGAVDRVQGAINLTGEYLYTYYEDHLREPKESAIHWIEKKTKPLVELVQKRFEKNTQ